MVKNMNDIFELYKQLHSGTCTEKECDAINEKIHTIASTDVRVTPEMLTFISTNIYLNCQIEKVEVEINRIRESYGFIGAVTCVEKGKGSLRIKLQPHIDEFNRLIDIKCKFFTMNVKMSGTVNAIVKEERG